MGFADKIRNKLGIRKPGTDGPKTADAAARTLARKNRRFSTAAGGSAVSQSQRNQMGVGQQAVDIGPEPLNRAEERHLSSGGTLTAIKRARKANRRNIGRAKP